MRRSALPLCVLLAILGVGCASGKSGADDGDDDEQMAVDAGDPADADTCPADPCAVLAQCGCGVAQVCDFNFAALDGSTLCRDVVRPGDEAANCDDGTECGGGYTCVAPGQCRKYCGGPDDCAAGAECFFQLTDQAGAPIADGKLCTKACTPERASDNGCPDDPQFGCRVVLLDPDGLAATGDEHFQTDCGGAGAGGNGASCASGPAACQAGFGCFSITTGNTSALQCKQICVWEVSGNAGPRTCATGTCTELSEPVALIGTTEYGICL